MTITEKIHTLFEPRSVAIIGASKSIGKWGFTFLPPSDKRRVYG